MQIRCSESREKEPKAGYDLTELSEERPGIGLYSESHSWWRLNSYPLFLPHSVWCWSAPGSAWEGGVALPVSPQSHSACSVQIYLLNAEDGIPGVVLGTGIPASS